MGFRGAHDAIALAASKFDHAAFSQADDRGTGRRNRQPGGSGAAGATGGRLRGDPFAASHSPIRERYSRPQRE
jgi:hypothetical protein